MYEKQKDFYLKMLGEENLKNLEDFSKLEIQKDEGGNVRTEEKESKQKIEEEKKDNNECIQPVHIPVNPLKKKENPSLLPPNIELLKNNNNNFVCCVNHSQLPINIQERDPKNYQGMPPCMLSNVIPAGKPSHVVAPLNIFANDFNE